MKKAIFFVLLTFVVIGCSKSSNSSEIDTKQEQKDRSLETIEDIIKLAEAGDAKAQSELGMLYYNGLQLKMSIKTRFFLKKCGILEKLCTFASALFFTEEKKRKTIIK